MKTFEEQFPSLKDKSFEAQKCPVCCETIDVSEGDWVVDCIKIQEHCLDKQIVKELVEKQIKQVEPVITPDGCNNVSAGVKIAMILLNDKLELGIDMKKYPNEFICTSVINTKKVRENIFEIFGENADKRIPEDSKAYLLLKKLGL